jgi:hypothetical protein
MSRSRGPRRPNRQADRRCIKSGTASHWGRSSRTHLPFPADAVVSAKAPRTLAQDEHRESQGAVDPRLLRWHIDSAAKLTTRASSRVEGAAQAGHGRSGRRNSRGIRALELAHFTGFASTPKSPHSPARERPSCARAHPPVRPAARSFLPGCFKTRRRRDFERNKPPHTFAPTDAFAVLCSRMRLLSTASDVEMAAMSLGGAA